MTTLDPAPPTAPAPPAVRCGCGSSCSGRPAPPPYAPPPGWASPDALDDTPTTVEDLAAAVKTQPHTLRRLLRALSCHGRLRGAPRRHASSTRRCPGCCARTTRTACATSRCGAPSRGRGTSGRGWTRRCAPAANVFEDMYGKELLRVPPRGRRRVGLRLQPGHDDVQRAVRAGRRRPAGPERGVLGRRHRRRPGAGRWRACWRSTPGCTARCSTCPGWWRNADPRLREGGSLAARVQHRGRGLPGGHPRRRRICTSSRTSWSGTTRAPAGRCANVVARRRGPAPGSS